MAHQFFDKTSAALENISVLQIRTLVGEFEYIPDNEDWKYEIRLQKQ